MANELLQTRSDTLDTVEAKIKELQKTGGINLPPNYSVSNALQSAWLILQETVNKDKLPVLENCTRSSIANALLKMCIRGLSPAKNQVYFIAYDTRLAAQPSYFGVMAITKRVKGVEDIYAQVVYEGDVFEFVVEKSTKRVTKHEQVLANIDSDKIIAAYCTIIHDDGQEYTEIITMKQIRMAWGRSLMKQNKNHFEFPEDMAKRTIINKTCKMFANTSDDSDLILSAIDEAEGEGDDEPLVQIKSANSQIIDIMPEKEPEPAKPEVNMPRNMPQETKQADQDEPDMPPEHPPAEDYPQMTIDDLPPSTTKRNPGW